MKKNILIILLGSLVFSSCGPSQEDMARMKVENAKIFLLNLDTTQAVAHLDSALLLYPKAVYSLNAAKKLKEEIYLDVIRRKESELASVTTKVELLEGNFIKEKTEFDHYIQYIHKRQNFDSRWNKSYLKVNLDERGEISFSSNYYGQVWLNHSGIRVYDGPNQASTGLVELSDPYNHRSDFMESKWEKVTYTGGKGDGVIEFIASNPGFRLKAVFLGNTNYFIILEENDKTAFREALALSKALKEKIVLENEIKWLQKVLYIEE